MGVCQSEQKETIHSRINYKTSQYNIDIQNSLSVISTKDSFITIKEQNHAQIQNYQILRTLGQGASSKVKLGKNMDDNKLYAIKIFKAEYYNKEKDSSINEEIEILKQIKHENIVQYKEYIEDAKYIKKNGNIYNCNAIVTEYCENGQLYDYLCNSGAVSEDLARTYFQQMIQTLEYLHGMGICHRDIKPENILLDSNFNVKICDFGYSYYTKGRKDDGLLRTICGTESYMAPEITNNRKYNGAATDIFSIGAVLFIMVSGNPAFNKADNILDPIYKLFVNEKKNHLFWKVHSRNKSENYFSSEFKSLINRILDQDPEQRITIQEIKQHPWLQGNKVSQDQIKNDFSQRKTQTQNYSEKSEKKEPSKQSEHKIFTGVKTFKN